MIKKMRAKLNEKKGFTLAELLIVVAIIAVLVAIAIPIFNTQLERAREATDLANVRAAYAEMMAAYLEWDGSSTISDITVSVKQRQDNWQSDGGNASTTISEGSAGGVSVPSKTSGDYTIKINTTTGEITVS